MKKVQEPEDKVYEIATGSTPYTITGKALKNNWKTLANLTPDNYDDGTADHSKDIIKKWCLSVKVE